MNEHPAIPMVVEIDDMTDLNPLILGLASMLALRLIEKVKASPKNADLAKQRT